MVCGKLKRGNCSLTKKKCKKPYKVKMQKFKNSCSIFKKGKVTKKKIVKRKTVKKKSVKRKTVKKKTAKRKPAKKKGFFSIFTQ